MKLEGWWKGCKGCKGWKLWLAITVGVVITIVLLIVILAFTVFKPKHLISTVDDISIINMDTGFNVFSISFNLNVSLEVDLSIKNSNSFGIKYYGGTSQLNYRGVQIGDAPIPNGDISAGGTLGMNITLTIMADRFLNNVHIPSDVNSGKFPLNTITKVYGEVIILGFIKFRVDSSSSCDFAVNIANETVESNVCQDETKI